MLFWANAIIPRFLAVLACVFMVACAPKSAKKADTELPRAAPSHIHWLQKQSTLAKAPEIIALVSQSERVWLKNSGSEDSRVLSGAAPNWLMADSGKKPVFRAIAADIGAIARAGFGGVYLGDTGERPEIWSGHDARPISLEFDAGFGGDADFELLAKAAESAGLELGMSVIGGATGQGPDFILQARNAPGYAGLYAMLPAPPESLSLLPVARDELDCQKLSSEIVARLADMGVLPRAMARDGLSWTSSGGWAATGPVMGVDGQERRWLYRYSGHAYQPVLAWQDPSGNATRLFSAAVIANTGLLGNALAGISLEPLMALEPALESGAASVSLSPGLDALGALARQIHSYGGWAMQLDPLPRSGIEAVLAGPCDFCVDAVTPGLVLFGLLESDGRPVARLYREWISSGTPVARMARGPLENINAVAKLLADNPEWDTQARVLRGASQRAPDSVVSGMTADAARRFLLEWRLGLPGLAFVARNENISADIWLGNTLKARKNAELANGKPLSVIRGLGGGFGLLSALPNGGFWLLACNFGVNPDELRITLPTSQAAARDAANGEDLSSNLSEQIFRIALDGRACKNVVFTQNKN